MNRTGLIFLAIYLLSLAPAPLWAEEIIPSPTDDDIFGPFVSHAPESELSLQGTFLEIKATITDNEKVAEASLLYRSYDPTKNEAYLPVQMREMGNGHYWVILPIKSESETIEYYIKAIDTAGNTTLRGHFESPLKITVALLKPKELPVNAATPLIPTMSPLNEVQHKSQQQSMPPLWKNLHKKWWFWAALSSAMIGVGIHQIDEPQTVIR
jgi:hypothetical protein